jgi:hypothetical protein
VISRLGQPHPFRCGGPPLSEGAAFGKGGSEVTAGEHGGQSRQAEALLVPCAVETRHVLLEVFHRPAIVPQAVVDNPQVILRRHGEANIPQVCGNGQGTLAGREGAVRVACHQKLGEQIGRDPPQPVLITQGFGKGLGFLQGDEEPPEFAQRVERIALREAEINSLLSGVLTLWELVQRLQRLLEKPHRLLIRRVGHGLGPSLAAVYHGLIPYLATQGVVCQSVDLLGQSVDT